MPNLLFGIVDVAQKVERGRRERACVAPPHEHARAPPTLRRGANKPLRGRSSAGQRVQDKEQRRVRG
eukprot:6183460-Pleurochrysis_carterae.AAC.3